jgi:hypothetical protein
MRPSLRHRLTSAHLIGVLALFLALGGGAYAAASLLPKNSVGSAQLKKGAVTPSKLSRSTVKKLAGARGRPGIQGVRGAQGLKGDSGAAGPSDIYAAGASSGALTTSYTQVASITVPAGQYLLQAKTTIFASSMNAAGGAACLLTPSLGPSVVPWDATSTAVPAVPTLFSSGVISLAGAASVTAPQTVILACKSTLGVLSFDNARVWAIKTGSLHATLPLPLD